MNMNKGRISVPLLIGLLLCLTFMGGVLRYAAPAAHGAGNYVSSYFSWPSHFAASGVITYSGATTPITPTATKIADDRLQLKFNESLELATNDRDGTGEGTLPLTLQNFSINGATLAGIETNRYSGTNSRRVFDVVELSTQSSIPAGATISYSIKPITPGNPQNNILAVPGRTRLLAPFDVPVVAAAATLTSVTVNGSSITPAGTKYTTTVDPGTASATVELAALGGTITYKGPSDIGYATYHGSFSVNLAEGSNLISIKVSNGWQETDYILEILRQNMGMCLASVGLRSAAFKFDSTIAMSTSSNSYSFPERILRDMEEGDLTVTLDPRSDPVSRVTASVNGGYEMELIKVTETIYAIRNLPLGFPSLAAAKTEIKVLLYGVGGGITPTVAQYLIDLYRTDSEAFLTDLKVYVNDSYSGRTSETTTTPPFDPAMRGRIVLEAPPFAATDGRFDQSFYVVPTANDGTEILVNGSPCTSGQPSAVYGFPSEGELSILITLRREMTSSAPPSYTVVIRKDSDKPMLKSLVVSTVKEYRQYPDIAPTLLKLAAADLTNGSSITVDSSSKYPWEAYIYGELPEGMERYMTVQVDGQTMATPASFASQKFSIGAKEDREVEIKVRNTISGQETVYKLHLVNRYIPIERIYIGVPPEVLADAKDPLGITVGINGAYTISAKGGSGLIGLGLSALASTTQPHQTTFEIPWSVWPPEATDREKVSFSVSIFGMTLSNTPNADSSGGVLTVSRTRDSALYSEKGLKDIEYVEHIQGTLVRAEVNGSKTEYKVDLSFKTATEPAIENYVVDMSAFELFPGGILPIVDPRFPHAQFVMQEGQSFVIPMSSNVPNWGAYTRLPEEMRKKFPIVYPYKEFSDSFAIPLHALYDSLYRRYNGQIPNDELKAFNARLIDYSYADDGYSFTLEWPAGVKKMAENAGFGNPSDYLTATWDAGSVFANAGVRVTCIKSPPRITGMLPITLTATTKITKQSDSTTISIPYNKISKASEVGTGTALIVSPRTYAFWENEDSVLKGKKSFMMVPMGSTTKGPGYNVTVASAGAAVGMAVAALLDMVKDMLMDILVAEGDIRIVWKNLAVKQPIKYYSETVKWALNFHNNDTRVDVVPDGIMWALYKNGVKNNGTENQIFTPFGDLDKTSGSTYPGIIGNLSVLADNGAARRFFDAHPHLLPLVGGSVDVAQGRFGPYELKVSGESITSSGMTPVMLTNSVLFYNLDPIDSTKQNSRAGGSNLSASGGIALNALLGAPGSRRATRATESGQLLYVAPVKANVGDFVGFHDDTASVQVLVSLGDDASNKSGMSASPGGMIECVVPMVGFADNIVVRDVSGNQVNSSFDLLENNAPLPESAKNSTAYQTRKAAAAGSSGSESFIIEFEVPSKYLEQVEVADIYFRREGAPAGFEVAKLSGEGINGGFTVSEHGKQQVQPQGSSGGGGCDATAAPLAFMVTLIMMGVVVSRRKR